MLLSSIVQPIALIANGEISDLNFLRGALRSFSRVIAVDGGLHFLDQIGVVPEAITGDFDSISPDLLKAYSHVPQISLLDQNKSDLEKTLDWLDTPEPITVFGALGKRVDHLLSNLFLLASHPKQLCYETQEEWIWAIDAEEKLQLPTKTTLSLIPLGTATDVTTQGLKWELHQATLSKALVSLSNVTVNKDVRIRVGSGELLICQQKPQ